MLESRKVRKISGQKEVNRGREKTAKPRFVTCDFQQIQFNCLKVVHEVVTDTPGCMKLTH